MAASLKVGDDVCTFTEDLEREILLRSPVESLLRFKCVCKSWYTLINSFSFIREHLGNKRQPQLLIYDPYVCVDNSVPMTIISEDKIGETPFVAKFDHHLQGQGFADFSSLISSVDGLFLLQKGYRKDVSLTLWNPATREVRLLPAFKFLFRPFLVRCLFGLGLDSFISNSYKVVSLCITDSILDGIQSYAAVYSCSTDSWRTLQPVSNEIINSDLAFFREFDVAIHLNGAYYWLLRKGNKKSILSFDFGSEVFGEIGGPDITSNSYLDITSLILLDNSTITMLNSNADRSVYDIWVLTQPVAAGVWSKLLTFQCPYPITNPCYGLWDSGTLIFLREEENTGRGFRLVSYDVRTQETRHLGYRYQGQRMDCILSYYKESLVTIKQRGRKMDKGGAGH